MKLRLRLMNGQMIVIENILRWEVDEGGLEVMEVLEKNEIGEVTKDKKSWFNRAYIATVEEEN